jgi:hypothetical protein
VVTSTDIQKTVSFRHPAFQAGAGHWDKYRAVYEGGEEFRQQYLERFTTRETEADYKQRLGITPIPSFAKAAINDIRNSIFQRLSDVIRREGSNTYQNAVNGYMGGVDRRGSAMNTFLGQKILTELLVMGRIGIFVDMPVLESNDLREAEGKRPYLYSYNVEDILSWDTNNPEEPSEFSALLLRDRVTEYSASRRFPTGMVERYRELWIDDRTGLVMLQFYDVDGLPTGRDREVGGGPIQLELTRIPFVMFDLGDSLIKDVCEYQIALLNLCSSDVSYALKANFPFYTEQRDIRAVGSHLKVAASEDGTATAGGQGADDTAVKVGVAHGRYYDMGADRPDFIHPSSEPLKASLELQDKLEADIRKLVNLAVKSLASRASAESKTMDNQGLEAGLSFIGLVLEAGEKKIAEFWAAYENRIESKRNVATIKYPDRYSLKTDLDRIDEAGKLSELMFSIPGRTVKKEIAKLVSATLFSGKVKVDTLEKINKEIEEAPYTTSNPDVIEMAKEQGLVSADTGSLALGFQPGEAEKAEKDRIERVAETALAQSKGRADGGSPNPAARGLQDFSADPSQDARDEKATSRNTDTQDTTKRRVRGKGK